MKKKLFVALVVCCSILESAAAQTTFKSIINTLITSVFRSLVTLAMAVATAAFTFGIYIYVMGARKGDSEQIAKGNKFLLWAGISLFMMTSVWGIITFGQSILGFRSGVTIPDMTSFRSSFQNSGSGGMAPVTAAQAAVASQTIQAQAAAAGKPAPENLNSCLVGGFVGALCQKAFGSGSAGGSSSAYNGGCDPQDESCQPASSSAYNGGCDPQDPSCGSQPSYDWYDAGYQDTSANSSSYDWYDAGYQDTETNSSGSSDSSWDSSADSNAVYEW